MDIGRVKINDENEERSTFTFGVVMTPFKVQKIGNKLSEED